MPTSHALARAIAGAAVFAGVFVSTTAAEGPFREGPQFQVNQYTTDFQWRGAVAAHSSGDFIVVWEGNGSSASGGEFNPSILGRLYDGTGQPLGPEFQVDSYTTYTQDGPDVAVDPAGNYIVVWESRGSSGSDTGSQSVQARRFDSAGNPLGTQFQVNTYTTGDELDPRVAAYADGFWVAWLASFSPSLPATALVARRFNNAGTPLGTEFQIERQSIGLWELDLTATPSGTFTAVWRRTSSDETRDFSVSARRLDSNGVPLGASFDVNTPGPANRRSPSVATHDSGSFVVVWDVLHAPFELTIQGRRFDSAGVALGSEFQINAPSANLVSGPAVAVGAAGDFVVTWSGLESSYPDSSKYSVRAQAFNNNGEPVNPRFQVNSFTTGYQAHSRITAADPHEWVVVWTSNRSPGSDSSYFSVQGQRFSTAALCRDVPESGCRLAAPGGEGRSSLHMRNSPNGIADAIRWTWDRGTATTAADFKDPAGAAPTYRLCIYEGISGLARRVSELDLSPGVDCGRKPCWRATGPAGAPSQLRYKHSSARAAPNRATAAKIRPGSAGRSRIEIKAKGRGIAVPTLPLVGDVTAQLLIDDGTSIECFQTTFPAPHRRNDANRFKAAGP